MLSKCANPVCNTVFKYFRQGRLFEFNVGAGGFCTSDEPPRKGTSRELFWLCEGCAQSLTLQCSDGRVQPVPRCARAA